MDTRNCVRCGRLFNYINKPICRECANLEEEEFESVRKYIKENVGANINEVSHATGVSTKRIMKYLREGRLEAVEGSGICLECEKCGKQIRSGRYCPECSSKMSNIVSGVINTQKLESKNASNKGASMHLSKFKNLKD